MTAVWARSFAPGWGTAAGGRAGFYMGSRGVARWPLPRPSGLHFGASPSGFTESAGVASAWLDAARGFTLTSSGANRPGVTTLGGLPALTFSKTGPRHLAQGSSPLAADAEGEVWMVVRSSNWARDAARGAILFSAAQYPTSTEINLRVWGTDGITKKLAGRQVGYNVNSASGGGTSLVHLRGQTQLADDTTYLLRWQSNGSAARIWINGAEETLTVIGGANNGYWFDRAPAATRCYLGNYVNSNVYALEGQIGFFMSTPGPLTDEGAEAWTRLLLAAFGIA